MPASMSTRVILPLLILASGLVGQVALEARQGTVRPELNRPLGSLPFDLGRWKGRDEPMDAEILERTQADDYLNRVYEDPSQPGREIRLWINYSRHGLNLRHSPEVCLPSGGWEKVESQTRVFPVDSGSGVPFHITRLVYNQGEVAQGVGFWYYIFGEGPVEKFARSLPISSRGSHGRTTMGSGLTVEIFYPGHLDSDGATLVEFTAALMNQLDPMLPRDRAAYHIP